MLRNAAPPAAGTIQTKLAVNKPGDTLEREADRVAEQVMNAPSTRLESPCACGGECPRCQAGPPGREQVQTKRAAPGGSGQAAAPPVVEEVLRSPGRPLDAATRSFMEPRFGHDFSQVRVHSGASAAISARQVNANAYTAGHHIVFAAGQFAPGTNAGQRLIAHELTHVVQQSGADRNATPISVQRDMDDILAGKIARAWNAGFANHASPYAYIRQQVDDTDAAFEDNVSAAFIELQSDFRLETFAGVDDGRAMLNVLYQAIMTGSVTSYERKQGERILDALKKGVPVNKYLADVEQAKIFPARNMGLTRFSYAVFSAKLQNGKVRVYYGDTHVDSDMFKKDLATLGGYRAARNGFELDPDQIVGVTLHDQGGVTVFVPALALIDFANQLSEHTLSLARTAFIAGLTVGAGGVGAAGGSRVLVWADRAVAAYSAVAMVVDEHRDWMLETFPSFGPDLLDAMDRVNGIVAYYGYARMGLDGIRFVRSKLGPAWGGWRKEAGKPSIQKELSSSERTRVKEIDDQTGKLLNELAEGEAAEAAKSVKQRPPKAIEGKAGNRRVAVGKDHEIVEVRDPSLPSGIGCEYHSPGGPRVPCPTGMGTPEVKKVEKEALPPPKAPKEKAQKPEPPPAKAPKKKTQAVSRYTKGSREHLVELDRKFPKLEGAHVTIKKRGAGSGMREESMFTNGGTESFEAKLRSGEGVQLDDITPDGVVVEIKQRSEVAVLRGKKVKEYMEKNARRELDFETNKHLDANVRQQAETAADKHIDMLQTKDLETFEDQLVRQHRFIEENGLPGGEWITDSEAAAAKIKKIIAARGLNKIKVTLVK
jgi:hypothetical protein